MYAIIDKRVSETTIKRLCNYTEDIFLFETRNITYNSISGHPDIFIYQEDNNLIVAPNSPQELLFFFEKHNISYNFGNTNIGYELANTTAYNCVATRNFFFHKIKYTDPKIKSFNREKKIFNLPQAYTACSLLVVNETVFITSDLGILKTLKQQNLEVYYFSPSQIRIYDHKHGFFGGCTGMYENKLFFCGNILLHDDANIIKNICEKHDIEIICLDNSYLYDCGKILFVG